MSQIGLLRRMAQYNQWMNGKLYSVAAELEASELALDRGAFFGSILGTLNHLVVGDTLWLKRFARHPGSERRLQPVTDLDDPVSLDQILFTELSQLGERRQWLDGIIMAWVDGLQESDLVAPLDYHNSKGVPSRRPLGELMLHFFNHQTHHRGQASTLLSQAGKDLGVTDLLVLIPDALKDQR